MAMVPATMKANRVNKEKMRFISVLRKLFLSRTAVMPFDEPASPGSPDSSEDGQNPDRKNQGLDKYAYYVEMVRIHPSRLSS
jgi:hypothetical protein